MDPEFGQGEDVPTTNCRHASMQIFLRDRKFFIAWHSAGCLSEMKGISYGLAPTL